MVLHSASLVKAAPSAIAVLNTDTVVFRVLTVEPDVSRVTGLAALRPAPRLRRQPLQRFLKMVLAVEAMATHA